MLQSRTASTETNVASPAEATWRTWGACLALACLLLAAVPACGLLGDEGDNDGPADEDEEQVDEIPPPPGRP